MTDRVIFVESPAQAAAIVAAALPGRCVALTAEAAQAFEELGHACDAVCKFTDTYALADIDEQLTIDVAAAMRDLELFVGERVPSVRFEGPGIFYGQAYSVQYSVGALLKRLYLMRAAIDALKPPAVLAYTQPIDPWFAADGYRENPWTGPLRALAASRGIELELQPGPPIRDARPTLRRGNWLGRLMGRIRAELQRLIPKEVPPMAGRLDGLRILMVDLVAFDWVQTVKVLTSASNVDCYVVESSLDRVSNSRSSFTGALRRIGGAREAIDLPAPFSPPDEDARLVEAIDAWCAAQPTRLSFMGFEMLEAIRPHLHALAKYAPALIRRTDALAERLLDITRPHALCFFSIGNLADLRLAQAARKRGIPNVTYQHGFAYGVQIMAKDEFTDPMNADYFLVYGRGIRPRDNPAFQVRAKYVPVGSARIEEMVRSMRRSRMRGDLRVLWIAETSTRNTLTPSLTEDTRRYFAQQRCFETLAGASGVRLTYRPYRHSYDYEGTQRWLNSRRLPNVRTDIGSRLEYLIAASDVVICEASSPTTWIEVLALGVPMILLCDPRQTLLVPDFERDLTTACLWCRSHDELLSTVARLRDDRDRLLAELRAIDATRFVRDYAIDRGDCAAHAAAFLSQVCRGGASVDSWRTSHVAT
jgi:hypothetical protein